jgi:hypothetical protein
MNKAQRRVLKRFPEAKLSVDENGYRIVVVNNVSLTEEYFLPDTNDDEQAWEYAAIAAKVTQNFNRTHPARIDSTSLEEKIGRIENRKRKGRVNAKR